LALQNAHEQNGDKTDYKKLADEGIQICLKEWHSLPKMVSHAHIPLLHSFQIIVEMQEAALIQDNLLTTNISNIEAKSQELKGILITWRERLPNIWDDVNIWSDLVAWRQHIFTTINKSYVPLLPLLNGPTGGAPPMSHAYRGYHETAWIINRFSHVARKHQLTDVCISSLSKIYTLPNIEIPEAFYKLREQAKCYFQYPSEYSTGLDVINNTNLRYFSPSQKAEFFTLKGVFMSKMNLVDEANHSFASATQIEMGLPKAWAAWGQFNDKLFKDNPKEMKYGVNAINCYLQAAGLYNNSRSRKYLARILWLLNLDDSQQSLSKSYEMYKGDVPLWYWITFIPQLLTSLGNKEAQYTWTILMKLAKNFPQVRILVFF
jgi:transformation/transcription domain-associated protein